LSEGVRTNAPALYVANQYFRDAALEWVGAGDSPVGIEVRDYMAGELQIPRYKADYIGFLTVIVLPLAIFLRGLVVWRKRRFL
jgi:hypothetical protein